jgi:hypothetical protein
MRLMLPAIVAVLLPLTAVGQSEVDSRCPITAFDRPPSLLGTLDSIRTLLRAEGFSGRFTFRLTLTETGGVRDVVVTSPESLKSSQKVRQAIAELKFCPAVSLGRDRAAKVNFEVRTD